MHDHGRDFYAFQAVSFSGSELIFYHSVAAIRHVIKTSRKNEREDAFL